MKKQNYLEGSIVKGMLYFVVPYLMGLILQSLYGAVDLFVVGKFASTADVSAVTIGSQLMNMVTQLIVGLATGITVLVGQQYGGKEYKGIASTVKSGAAILSIVAIVITAIYIGLSNSIIRLMKTPAEAVSATKDYLVICAIGIVFITGYNIISSMLMGIGNSRTPFIFIAIACVINIVFDLLLVRVFHMGAAGAAVATTMAQACSFIFAVCYIKLKGIGFEFSLIKSKVKNSIVKKTIKIGAPVAIQNVLVGASFLFITAIINSRGLAASAASGVVEKLFGFFIMPAVAFSAAIATISAQNKGAGNMKRAKQSMQNGIWMALIPSVLLIILCQFQGQTLASLFSTDPEVIMLADNYIRSYVTDCALVCFVFCMNGYFNGTGYSWFSMVHSLISTFLFRVPLSYIFSLISGSTLYTIGWAAPLSTLVSLILCIGFLAFLKQKEKKSRENTGYAASAKAEQLEF